jgi:hypothetical protein
MSGDIAMGTHNISGGGTFTATSFVGTLTGGASLDLPLAGGTMSGAIAMGSNNITGGGTGAFTTMTLSSAGPTLILTDAAPGIQIPAAGALTFTTAVPKTLMTLTDIGGTGKLSITGDFFADGAIQSNTIGATAITAPSGGINSGTPGPAGVQGSLQLADGGSLTSSAFSGTIQQGLLTVGAKTYTLPDVSGTFLFLQPSAPQVMASGAGDGIQLQLAVGGADAFMTFRAAAVGLGTPIFTVGNTGELVTNDKISISNTTGASLIAGTVSGATTLNLSSFGGVGSLGMGIGTGGAPNIGLEIQSTQFVATPGQDLILLGANQLIALTLQGSSVLNGIAIDGSTGSYDNGIHIVGVGGTSTFGAKFEGNASATDGSTNSALALVSGEINIARQATTAASTGGTQLIVEDDAAAADLGPSGVVDFVVAQTIAAPGANAVTTNTQVVHNIYANATSIVIATILNTDAANFDRVHESASISIEARGTGVFTLRVTRQAGTTASAGGTWQPRIGFIVINANK